MASTNDKVTDTRNAARPVSTTVSTSRSTGGTTLACASLTGWPTASKVHFVTYKIDTNSNPVSGTQLDCSGIVSGSSITSLTIEDGTDAGNAVGDVVEMLPTAKWGQDLSDALLIAHDRTGAIKSAYVTEAMQVLADNTTNNVSTTKHGYVPKTPNDATKFLDGTGAYSTPSSSTSPWTLLKANSGTHNTNAITNVDTFAITGLTAKDTLVIYLSISANVADVAASSIYSTTDSQQIVDIFNSTIIGAGKTMTGQINIVQNQVVNTKYNGFFMGGQTADVGGTTAGVVGNYIGQMATAWTGSWTIALRLGATLSSNTKWAWQLYKIAGQ